MGLPRPTILHGLLLFTVTVPALVFFWGRDHGEIAFVLYRQPKLVAIAISGWIFLAAFYWAHAKALRLDELTDVLEHPAVLGLTGFLSYLAATSLWVRVSENFYYEMSQYVLLFALLITLLVWAARDARVAAIVRYGLVASLAAVTLVGAVQIFVPMPFLTPIDPGSGVANPSLMGYKNPMALALLGQVFLLAHLLYAGPVARSKGWRIAGGALLAVELIYLASLNSRTAYTAFFAAVLYLVVLRGLFLRARGRLRWRLLARWAGVAAFVLTLFGSFLMIDELRRQKVHSVLSYLKEPYSYLESDRGTYLLNTLNIVRHNPWGVGLGDWQTHYPAYRLHHRNVYFSATQQVRRAHSDHVQILGEGGWPGVALWSLFLLILIGGATRDYLRSGNSASLFISVQLVALAIAMCTDYLLEMPYNKFQFFLIVFLALALHPGKPRRAARAGGSPAAPVMAALITVAMLVNLYYYGSLARKVWVSAALRGVYLRNVDRLQDEGQEPGRIEVASLLQVVRFGREFDRLTGHTKTFHKDYLLLAQTAFLLDRREAALAYARRALELHPYYPNAYQLMAVLVDDPEDSSRWARRYEYLMQEATTGFHPADDRRLPAWMGR